MYTGKTVFTQLLEHLPLHRFRLCVKRYNGINVKLFGVLPATLLAYLCHVSYLLWIEDMTSHTVHENIASSLPSLPSST